jgi:sulfur carrier protein
MTDTNGQATAPIPQTPPEPLRLVVNGEPRELAAGSSAHDLIVAAGLAGRPLAVEVNQRIVPRRDLPACMLHDGDRIEIVTLVGGG